MAIVGVLGGLSIALGLTPLGFIPVGGPTRATIMHIPVIIGGILEGPPSRRPNRSNIWII